MNARDYEFVKRSEPQAIPRLAWLAGALQAALLLVALAAAMHLTSCTPLAYKQEPGVWNLCECTTDSDCAERCGGNGDPSPTKEVTP